MSKTITYGNTKKRGYPEYIQGQYDRDSSSAEALQMLSRNIIDTTIKTEKNSQIVNDIPRFQKGYQPEAMHLGNRFLPLTNSNYSAFPLLMSEKLHNVSLIGEEIARVSSTTVDIDRLSELCLSLATEIREIHIMRSLQILDPIMEPNASNLVNTRYQIGYPAGADAVTNKVNIRKNEEESDYSPEKRKNQHSCELCRTTCTPEWRRGPTGRNTLCNACGLRYAKRLRADMSRHHPSTENNTNRDIENNILETTRTSDPINITKKMDINSMIN